MSDSDGSVQNTNAVVLTVENVPSDFQVSASPSSLTVATGESAYFVVSVSGGVSPYLYQWYEGTSVLSGKTSSSLVVSKSVAGLYSFYCEVSDSDGSVQNTNAVVLTVNDLIKVSTPSMNPAGGSYLSAQHVTISCATSEAIIRYTTDGSEPSTSSPLYSGSINVESGTVTIKAKAYKSGMTDSDIASATYTISITPSMQYTLIVTPAQSSVNAGGTATSYTINAAIQTGSTSEINLTLDSPPSWLEYNFNPSFGNPTFASALSVRAPSNAQPGTYTIRIRASGSNSDDQTATITLVINLPPEDNALFLPFDVIVALSAIVIIIISVALVLSRLKKPPKPRMKFVPSIDDPVADQAIVHDNVRLQKKLKLLKAKYPEFNGIRPASSPDELLSKTKIDSELI